MSCSLDRPVLLARGTHRNIGFQNSDSSTHGGVRDLKLRRTRPQEFERAWEPVFCRSCILKTPPQEVSAEVQKSRSAHTRLLNREGSPVVFLLVA